MTALLLFKSQDNDLTQHAFYIKPFFRTTLTSENIMSCSQAVFVRGCGQCGFPSLTLINPHTSQLHTKHKKETVWLGEDF